MEEKDFLYAEKISDSILKLFSYEKFQEGLWPSNGQYKKLEELSGAKINSGETKIIFHYEDNPGTVYKVPIYSDFQPLARVPARHTKRDKWDYCFTETELYKKACAESLGRFFTPMEKIYQASFVPVYKSTYMPMTLGSHFSPLPRKTALQQLEQVNPEMVYFASEQWVDYQLEFLFSISQLAWISLGLDSSCEELYNLLDFITKYQINDLHDENIGMINHTKPIFLDYAGYYEDTASCEEKFDKSKKIMYNE